MDTIVAPITPVVNSAVILLRISGTMATKVFSLLYNKKGENNIIPQHALSKLYTFKGVNVTDDVMATFFQGPKSYTGEDTLEISFHGNPITLRLALQDIYNLGIRHAEAGEFTKRAFLNGKLDLSQAEAVQELIAAKTEKGVHYAYNQLNGRVSAKFINMQNSLLNIKAHIEAKLDFPDEETGSDEIDYFLSVFKNISSECKDLITSYNSLRKENRGISITIAGKPNVGKSSLLNAILKEDRAIVSDTAGTTRDFIKEHLFIGNMPVELIDTAGVRNTNDNIENQGVAKSYEKIKDSHIVLVILDLSRPIDDDDKEVLEFSKNQNRIIIGNKCDKDIVNEYNTDINVSAAKNINIDDLINLIHEKTSDTDSDIISDIASVTERHLHLISELSSTIEEIVTTINVKPQDMIALDLDYCIKCLMEITGQIYTEDILDRIFSTFCIGK